MSLAELARRIADQPALLDAEYVTSVRARIRMLIDMDIQFGGDQLAEIALRLFRSAHRKIGTTPCVPGIQRDLHAVVGELGEVAGWLLYDAGKHELTRATNFESLNLSRIAGDRSIELLTLQNMSMHAGHLGRPVESLNIARMVLETSPKLSPRLQALFRTREARALAQMGDEPTAERTFRQARSLYLDGVRDDDPGWAWWLHDGELEAHDAVMRADAADWRRAIDAFHASIARTQVREARHHYFSHTNLFHAQVWAKSWRDAGETMERVAPFVGEVGSARIASTLVLALDTLDGDSAPLPLRETSRHLRVVLADAGYGSAA